MKQTYAERKKQQEIDRDNVLERAKKMDVTARAKGGMAGVHRVEMDVRELDRLLDRLEEAEKVVDAFRNMG